MNKKLLLMVGVLSIIGSTTMAANENTVIENKPNGDVVYRAEHVLDPGRNIYDKTTINHSGIVINRNNDVNNIYIGFNNPHLAENDGIGYVSFGNSIIHHVADGIAGDDVVTVFQLKDVESIAKNNEKVINDISKDVENNKVIGKISMDWLENHEGRIQNLEDRVVDISSNTLKQANQYTDARIAKVGASASALAALHPLDYNPDHKIDVMGGVGHYRGKTAVALGAAYRPNENLMFTVGTAINGKDSSVNAGVSYKVGAKDSTYKSQASLAKDVEDLKQMVIKLQAELEEARKK